MTYEQEFAAGLDLADRLIHQLHVRDPELLRVVAELMEQRAGSALEAGVARGYLIAAGELEENRLVGGVRR
jgi:hypothetical protein